MVFQLVLVAKLRQELWKVKRSAGYAIPRGDRLEINPEIVPDGGRLETEQQRAVTPSDRINRVIEMPHTDTLDQACSFEIGSLFRRDTKKTLEDAPLIGRGTSCLR
jgi:hypothetical protein